MTVAAFARRSMRAEARVRIERGGVLRELTSQPPLTLRRLHHRDREVCALAVVGSAAGPLDGDRLRLIIELGDGADATFTAAGASLALGRYAGAGADRAGLEVIISLGAGARLSGDTGSLIVGAQASLDVSVAIEAASDAAMSWRELIVLGRYGETAGDLRSRWDVTRDGRPLLRQLTDLSDPALRRWPGSIAQAKVLATDLALGPGVQARTFAGSRTSAVHRLAEDAQLTTVLATDAVSANRELARLQTGTTTS